MAYTFSDKFQNLKNINSRKNKVMHYTDIIFIFTVKNEKLLFPFKLTVTA